MQQNKIKNTMLFHCRLYPHSLLLPAHIGKVSTPHTKRRKTKRDISEVAFLTMLAYWVGRLIPKIAKSVVFLFIIFPWWRRVSDAFFEALKMSNSAKKLL
jgi:hypothetical protein